MAMGKAIKEGLKKLKLRAKSMDPFTYPYKRARARQDLKFMKDLEKIKNVSPALAGSLGVGIGGSKVQEMKSGGVVSSKSKSSGVALKGFGKEIK